MPILDVQVIGELPSVRRKGLAQRLADAAGDALKSAPGATWVKVVFMLMDHYAENGGGRPWPPGGGPVFVTVLRRKTPKVEQLREDIAALTKAVADACGRPAENVHVLYEPAATGRVGFGGRLVE